MICTVAHSGTSTPSGATRLSLASCIDVSIRSPKRPQSAVSCVQGDVTLLLQGVKLQIPQFIQDCYFLTCVVISAGFANLYLMMRAPIFAMDTFKCVLETRKEIIPSQEDQLCVP